MNSPSSGQFDIGFLPVDLFGPDLLPRRFLETVDRKLLLVGKEVLRSSIGIAPTWLLAKVASHWVLTGLPLVVMSPKSLLRHPQAVSRAAASGMWQFMPATGKDFDLKQNLFRDDRRDVLQSTRAALDYLQMLQRQFGDWQLALAAYNWGQGNVQRAIERNQKSGLPDEQVFEVHGSVRNLVCLSCGTRYPREQIEELWVDPIPKPAPSKAAPAKKKG